MPIGPTVAGVVNGVGLAIVASDEGGTTELFGSLSIRFGDLQEWDGFGDDGGRVEVDQKFG